MRASERAKYIFRISRAIQEKARELAIVESMDGGKPIKEAPRFFLGAAFNPVSVSMDSMLRRLEKKADKGAKKPPSP